MMKEQSMNNKADITNIAQGQVSEGFTAALDTLHENMMRVPRGTHEATIKIKFHFDIDKNQWLVTPQIKVSCKQDLVSQGVSLPIIVSEDGIFQPESGKQSTFEY